MTRCFLMIKVGRLVGDRHVSASRRAAETSPLRNATDSIYIFSQRSVVGVRAGRLTTTYVVSVRRQTACTSIRLLGSEALYLPVDRDGKAASLLGMFPGWNF